MLRLIRTQISLDHIELIKIFIKANELDNMVAVPYKFEVSGKSHHAIELQITNESTEEKLSIMSMRNSGVSNMLDDFLLKCGVPVDAINPKSIHRQLQDEREKEINEKFISTLPEILARISN